jgi:hypothetical protein
MAQCVENCDARTHERSCFVRRHLIGNGRERRRRCDHVLGVTAVEIDTRDLTVDTHGEIAAPALFANETMSAVPANADALPFLPVRYVVTDGINPSGNLMSGNTRILKPRPQPFLNQDVAMANATCFHLDPNLSYARLWYGTFDDFEIATGFTDLRRFHWCAHRFCQPLFSAHLAGRGWLSAQGDGRRQA